MSANRVNPRRLTDEDLPLEELNRQPVPTQQDNGLDPSDETESDHNRSSISQVEPESAPVGEAKHAKYQTKGDNMSAWSFRLNGVQLLLTFLGLLVVLYMLKPQLADHELNEINVSLSEWSAWKDFRDECRTSLVSLSSGPPILLGSDVHN
jgi:hypothetical protein